MFTHIQKFWGLVAAKAAPVRPGHGSASLQKPGKETAMTAETKKSPNTAQEIVGIAAKAALKKAGGDSRNAAILMEKGAKKNPALYKALTEPYLSDACWEAVRLAAHSQRKRIWSVPAEAAPTGRNMVGTKFGQSTSSPQAEEQKNRVVALARGNAATLLNFPLPIAGLPKLGEATLSMLKQAAEFYGKQSADMAGKAKWLGLIIAKMPDEKKKVGDVLDDGELRKLQAKAGASDAE